MSFKFTVPGSPTGYYAEGKYPNLKRRNAYVAYKQNVQACAMAAGLRLPLVASREAPLMIHVVSYFETGVHSDPGNVQKGIVDALFYSGRRGKGTGDKWTGGSFPPPRYDRENPRVEIRIEKLLTSEP